MPTRSWSCSTVKCVSAARTESYLPPGGCTNTCTDSKSENRRRVLWTPRTTHASRLRRQRERRLYRATVPCQPQRALVPLRFYRLLVMPYLQVNDKQVPLRTGETRIGVGG